MTRRLLAVTITAGVGLLLQCQTATAQAPPLTLAAAVAQALDHYPAVQVASRQIEEAQASVSLSRTTFLPRADLVWQANLATRNNISGLLLPQSVIGSITGPINPAAGDTSWNHAAGALVAWEPIDFGARSASVKSAEAGQHAAGVGLELARLRVAAVTADTYLAALAAEQGQRAARAAVERARTVFAVVDARARAGLRPGADAARARAEVAVAETELALMERDAAIARAELARWVGVPPEQIQLAATSPEPARTPATPASAQASAATGQHAAESAAAVQLQAAQVAVAESTEAVAAHAWAPRIVLEATAFTREGGFGPDGMADSPAQAAHNWAAGVNVTFPLFDWSAQGARRAVEHARVREAAARYDQIVTDVRTEQTKAQASLEAAYRVAALAAPQLDAARAAEEQARARYNSGLGTIADVAETGRLLTDAEVNSAVAAITAQRAAIAVAAAGGTLRIGDGRGSPDGGTLTCGSCACALRRPISLVVVVLAMLLSGVLATRRMPVDIFPKLGSPTVFVAQPYGGMDPQQMEGFLTYYYEYHFLYITGIEHVESKSIQGAALMKLVFHPGTDMSQAMAEVVGYVNRARAFMPPGAVPPFITRYDAGSVPVGQLVFSSPTRSPSEMQDFALNRVRPLFATLPGVSAPPPFGGNQKTVVVRLDPDRMREYGISPEEATSAVSRATLVVPSGNVRTGELTRIAQTNASLGADMGELLNAPVRTGAGATVFVRDIGAVEVATDIVTGYAHVNGQRTVYIPVTKRADASTLDVINRVKAELPRMKQVVPEDVDIRLEFDQSRYVVDALRGLAFEAALGALLTGLAVLLFLREWRSSLIVVVTIPLALVAALVALWGTGQTLNIMTLGGLALAVGILVDEATVSIEAIHGQLASGASRARAVVLASSQTAVPRLLAMICVLSVFLPSLFMTGVGRQLFVPLSVAVAFAMIASYLLSSTLVPVLASWVLRAGGAHAEAGWLVRLRASYARVLRAFVSARVVLTIGYLLVVATGLFLLLPRAATEIFPTVETGQIQLRLRAPTGTRIERTELVALEALDIVKKEVGPEHVLISTAFIGVQPASYPINTIYLFTSGPQEAVMQIALTADAARNGNALKERLRAKFAQQLPLVQVSFEAADIISQVMSFGSPTPIEIAVQGPDFEADRAYAMKIHDVVSKLPFMRDLQFAQAMDYPTLMIDIDRERAGQVGLTTSSVARSVVAATSSSRFIEPNYWRDPGSGNAFQIQVEIPQHRMATVEDVEGIPVGGAGASLLSDVATVSPGTTMGLIERYNMQRVVSITGNIEGMSLGQAAEALRKALPTAGAPPRGVTLNVRGQIPALEETTAGLRLGLLLAVLVIFLLLAAFFQSFKLSLAVLTPIPAALVGVLLMLLLTGTTLNVQSFMGAIMATGIAVANAILLVSQAENNRLAGQRAIDAAVSGASGRLRAVLMTATAMSVGMIPMAIGAGSGGEASASLGRAVEGGLVASTLATLFVLPSIFALIQQRATMRSPSLDPDDPGSRFHE